MVDINLQIRNVLSNWDSKLNPLAALTDNQKDGFMELAALSSNRPLPVDLPQDDYPSVTTKPTVKVGQGDESLDQVRIQNAQEFFSWFSDMEDKIANEEHVQQRDYIKELELQKTVCGEILDEVSKSLNYLEDLKCKFVYVSTKTNALHEACEYALEEQTQLVNQAETINNRLSYFIQLEQISSKLGSPTLTVTNESFVPMLSRLDECIAYLNRNPQYKESSVYMTRFKQCLSRALNLIKSHVTTILQTATQQVVPSKEILKADNNAFTMFYGKFRTNAPRVKSLMEQIETRLDKSPEYEQLFSDCLQCYFQQRMILLGPSVSNAVSELAKNNAKDHCALVRSGCAFMVHVCEDEYQLYRHFFSQPNIQLDQMLETLCTNLYDVLRPLIIHVNHLETLAELCSILKMEMLEDHVVNNVNELGAFETVCRQMLEDVQERLVYRTHIYIRQEILQYHPVDGDLAYPTKLEMMQSIAESLQQKGTGSKPMTPVNSEPTTSAIGGTSDDGAPPTPEGSTASSFVSVSLQPESGPGGNMPMSPADLHGMWYPTVRRTLVCLSKLYRCIDRTTFQGLSQETLSLCIQSLIVASDAIKKKASLLDAFLFLIKHLLILREQIAPFNVEFTVRETGLDFSKMKDAAYGLIRSRSRLFALNSNNALLQFLFEGTPTVIETFIDSKREVDTELKKTCEEFIQHVTETLIGPLLEFHNKSNTIFKMKDDPSAPKVSLRQQPFASPEKLQALVAETYRNLKNRKAKVQTAMTLYLANKDTEYILFKPIKTTIHQNYQQLIQILQEHYTEEDQQIVACPSLEQINLLLMSAPDKK